MKRACLAFTLFSVASLSAAQQYTIEDLGIMDRFNASIGQAIASNGDVAGYQNTDSFTSQATYWPFGGAGQALGTLGGNTSVGYGVNANGWVVGQSKDGEDNNIAFRWTDGGGMVNMGTLGGTTSVANKINNSNEIVGTSFLEGGGFQAFTWNDTDGMVGVGPSNSNGYDINESGQITGSWLDGGSPSLFRYTPGSGNELLGRPEDTVQATGLGIADNGDIVGYASPTGSTYFAFLFSGSDFTALDGLFNYDTRARDINNLGQIVGSSWLTDSAEDSQAVIWDNSTTAVNLNTLIDGALGWNLMYAYGINDLGQITGYGMIGGEVHAYRLTPVPEPATMIALGLGALGLAFRRRKS